MPTLKIDLHTHLKVSKRTPLREGEALRYADQARARGIDAIAVTEHFHAQGFWAMYHSLLAEFPCRRGRFEVESVLFFVGAELRLAEGADAVLLTTLPDLKAIDEAFPTPLSSGYFPTADELARTLARIGSVAVRVAAHPFRQGRGLDVLDPTAASELFHAAEINARFCEDAALARTRALASVTGAPVVGGSDAHVWTQVGAAWTEIEFFGAPTHHGLSHGANGHNGHSSSNGALNGRHTNGHAAAAAAFESATRPRLASRRHLPPDISFDDLRDALLSPAPERVIPALHPDAEAICRDGAALKASLKATLPKIDSERHEYA